MIIINEVNSDSPGSDQEEFLELGNTNGGSTSLDGYIVVLFNGYNDKVYKTIDLTGYKTRPNGLFLLGAAKFSPDINLTSNWLQNGADAVTLYNASTSRFPVGATPNQTGLVDAVVYSKDSNSDAGLLRALVPGQSQLREDDRAYAEDESLTRCHNKQPRNQSAFILAPATPGTPNNCTKPPTIGETPTTAVRVPGSTQTASSLPTRLPVEYLVINEVNADSNGTDTGEFVELSDGGVGNRSLDGFLLVLYRGNKTVSVYDTIDLTNQTTRSNGLFLIGGISTNPDIKIPRQNFLKNAAAAVAIHKGSVNDYPSGKTASTANLVDVVVYTKYPGNATAAIDRLLPGQTRIRELETFHPADEAISRCYCRQRFLPSFQLELQTPGQPNNCSGYVRPKPGPVYINELNADTPGHDTQEFLELYDGGIGFSCLDDLTLVFFSAGSKGTNDVAYRVITLSGNTTNKDGYFVIAQPAVRTLSNQTDLIIRSSFIENGADAVALYNVDDGTYSVGMSAKTEGLRDAIVYGKDKTKTASKLISILMPGQAQIHENPNYNTEDESISRCTRCKAPFSQAFTLSHATPGGPNNCTGFSLKNYFQPTLLINELNTDNPNADKMEFIELYDGGHGGICLFNRSLVLYNGGYQGNWAGASYAVDLSHHSTDRNGFLLIGSPDVNPDIALPLYKVQNGPDAIAVYRGATKKFTLKSFPVSGGLVDAVVYSVNNVNASLLLSLLTPGQEQLKEDPNYLIVGDETLSRCLNNNTLDLSAFVITHPTPRRHNDCSRTTVQPTTVSISAHTASTASRYPTNKTTGKRFTTRYPSSSTPATSTISSVWSSPPTAASSPSASISLATDFNGVSTAPSTSTPFVANEDAIRYLVINEVNADQPGIDEAEFVELYDGGRGATSLDNVVLVLFNGNSDDRSYKVIDLSGNETSDYGFFVIGTPAVHPRPNVVIRGGPRNSPFLQNGADAIALYSGTAEMFPEISKPKKEGLIDVVIYGTGDQDDHTLLAVLAPGQSQVNEDWSHHEGDESISRCLCCQQQNLSAFITTHPPTPGKENACWKREITVTLETGDCGKWKDNDTEEVLSYLAKFVNQKCGCTFTVGKNVMSGGRAHCDGDIGQLVVSAIFLENNDALLERDVKLYEEFLAETRTISIGKVRYQVASTCCASGTSTASVPSGATNENKDSSNGKDFCFSILLSKSTNSVQLSYCNAVVNALSDGSISVRLVQDLRRGCRHSTSDNCHLHNLNNKRLFFAGLTLPVIIAIACGCVAAVLLIAFILVVW